MKLYGWSFMCGGGGRDTINYYTGFDYSQQYEQQVVSKRNRKLFHVETNPFSPPLPFLPPFTEKYPEKRFEPGK